MIDALAATATIDEAPMPICSNPVLPDAEVVVEARVDLDTDGSLETVQLVHTDDNAVLRIDGLANGTIWGEIATSVLGNGVTGADALAWTDWNADGVPEFLHRGDGPASGDLWVLTTIDGCSVVPVVDGAGDAVELLHRASGLSADGWFCEEETLVRVHSDIDPDTGEATNTFTYSAYTPGRLLITGGLDTVTSEPLAGREHGIDSCVIERFA